jgi:hypothetical protein
MNMTELLPHFMRDFRDLVTLAYQLRTTDESDPITVKAAVIGFSLFYPVEEWRRPDHDFIMKYVNCEPSMAALSPSREWDEAILVFSCIALGAALGAYNAGQMSHDDFLKSEWYILAFTSLHGRAICSVYEMAKAECAS